ncbi:MAG: hypothetical protein JW776_14240 [Candidatus Lokiarchaeota archaeon]|nr:hypothetical protein [Candidatus Lokiarchaeota archaeon]
MSFTPENLHKVFKNIRPREQQIMMGYLKEYIDNLCNECVSDRMNNVLNPMCRRRFLINVRILSGSSLKELPVFCYNQVLSNINRFIEGKTTLFTPVDVIIYNEDFFKLFFGRDAQELLKLTRDLGVEGLNEEGIKTINKIISKSNTPAIYSKTRKERPGILRTILKREKMIREGSFIYDVSSNYFIIWRSNTLFIADLHKGYAICNTHKEQIDSMEILDLIIPLYAEGKDFRIDLDAVSGKETLLQIGIKRKNIIQIEDEQLDQRFSQITEDLSPKFPRTTFNFTEKLDLQVSVEVNKNSTFDDVNFVFNKLSTLMEAESINLLNEI